MTDTETLIYDRDGRVYVRPVGRGVHFVDGDEAYLDEIVERLVGGGVYAHVKLRLEVTPESRERTQP